MTDPKHLTPADVPALSEFFDRLQQFLKALDHPEMSAELYHYSSGVGGIHAATVHGPGEGNYTYGPLCSWESVEEFVRIVLANTEDEDGPETDEA